MTKLDELMLTGQWLQAIKHVREYVVLNDTRDRKALDKAILICAWRALQLGILDGAPRRLIRDLV